MQALCFSSYLAFIQSGKLLESLISKCQMLLQRLVSKPGNIICIARFHKYNGNLCIFFNLGEPTDLLSCFTPSHLHEHSLHKDIVFAYREHHCRKCLFSPAACKKSSSSAHQLNKLVCASQSLSWCPWHLVLTETSTETAWIRFFWTLGLDFTLAIMLHASGQGLYHSSISVQYTISWWCQWGWHCLYKCHSPALRALTLNGSSPNSPSAPASSIALSKGELPAAGTQMGALAW